MGSEATQLQVGYAFKSSWFQAESGTRLLRGENVGYGSPDWADCKYISSEKALEYSDYFLNRGDIVIGMDRTFTKTGFKISQLGESDCPALLVQRVGKYVPTSCEGSYLKILLQWEGYQRALFTQQKGMDIPHLSKEEILNPMVPVPTSTEQLRIYRCISPIESLIAEETTALRKFIAVKSGLLSDLLTGGVRVSLDEVSKEKANV